MGIRIIKRTYGTKDINELCQKAFEPYFQEEYTIDNLIKNQNEEEEK